MQPDCPTRFDPLVARWFAARFGTPTVIQSRAWQTISRGEHLLITAPTGSGKTLAAFLWALDQLITGRWDPQQTHVLYVSPLKALNNDVQRNLLTPLAQLREVFAQAQRPFPELRVDTRSGDTPPSDRRRMLHRPPQILITTPESLNLLLSSTGGRSLLGQLKTVILDEIHAILPSRRGTHLITAVERLVLLSGEFQRIALSATITPLERAAAFVGGCRLTGSVDVPHYTPRKVALLSATADKRYDLAVRQPPQPEGPHDPNAFWAVFAERVIGHLSANRSTLVFTNSRRLCEKLTYLINRDQPELLAYSHHGSLAREIRFQVERQLKAGRLKAIVATGSLELGIDIGALDEVIQIQSPWSVAEAIQRIGRAGHGVGQASRGTFYASHTLDLVSSAVVARAIGEADIETIETPQAPLDVLAQVLLSMVAVEAWHPQALYNFIRTAAPYANLSRRRFDLVLDMLEGRFQATRLRDLQPKIAHDRLDQRLTARKGALLALYTSGGVIPDRGYYGLRHAGNMAKIGELDEEFVWEARIGQEFTLGALNWRIHQITHSDVLVQPAVSGRPAPPFWRAEESARGFHLSEKILLFLESADAHLKDPALEAELIEKYSLDAAGARRLIDDLVRQRLHTGCSLPHRHHLVIEDTPLGVAGAANRQAIWHTLWGGRINRPLTIALEAAWEERFGTTPHIFAANDTITFLLPPELPVAELASLVRADHVEELVRRRLPSSGLFGARFRECAGRALLLPRRHPTQRMPLWLTRLKAQKLMAGVAGLPDFPILLETWRTCLQDEFDLPRLRQLLQELENGAIGCSCVRTPYPSPFARGSAWQQINQSMYQTDAPAPAGSGRVQEDLLHEVTLQPELRPRIDPQLVRLFEAKRQRIAPGYAPDSSSELLEWVKERVLLPIDEWLALLEAAARDHHLSADDLTAPLRAKLARITADTADGGEWIAAREAAPRLCIVFCGGPAAPPHCTLLDGQPFAITPADDDGASSALLAQWLRCYGPRAAAEISRRLGIDTRSVIPLLDELVQEQELISGGLTIGSIAEEWCDRENFEALLRLSRKTATPLFETLEIACLPLFLAEHQGVTRTRNDPQEWPWRLQQLLGWAAPAALWEKEILPARLEGYRTAWFDQWQQANDLHWIGRAGGKTFFCPEEDLDLVNAADQPEMEEIETDDAALLALLPGDGGRFPFANLLQRSSLTAAQLNQRLWRLVWAGRVSNDAFAALRRGIETNFTLDGDRSPSPPPSSSPAYAAGRFGRHASGRGAFERRHNVRPSVGNWFRINAPEVDGDPLEREERNKERARLLLDRYGVIFRELLARELPALRWNQVFRALRLMELSGEVVCGAFFSGIPGLQFTSPQTLPRLRASRSDDALDTVFWLNALDPASLCGIGLEALQGCLPRRLPGVHLVYHGSRLVIVSQQQAKRLEIRVPADHPRLADYFGFLQHLLTRAVLPLRSVCVETINAAPALDQKTYCAALAALFELTADPKGVLLYRRH